MGQIETGLVIKQKQAIKLRLEVNKSCDQMPRIIYSGLKQRTKQQRIIYDSF